ncbi:MAG: capsular polysaccharide biosynthesis protein [Oscillospiraceae bacterium]|nr:capsular polysaccharide biosynthesis protein [Oscillospiraceae bacterium]
MHSHILPNMDDGSDSVETTHKMLQMLRQQGVTTVAATPHFYAYKDNPEDFLRRREESLARDTWELSLLPGAEVAYFDGMSRCRELKELQIGDTGLLLVEMPFGKWTGRMMEELIRIPMEQGLTPLLAHVERYRSQLPKFLAELSGQQVAMQCNAEAFLSAGTRGWALSMVKKGYVQFLGTDTHNLTDRAPRYDEAVRVIEKKLGTEIAQRITNLV